MQEKVYRRKINSVDELNDRIISAWEEFDQRIIDTAIKQWRPRLRACVSANGGHFEHKIWIALEITLWICWCVK